MSWAIIGIIVVLAVLTLVVKLSTAICIVFAISFWGGLAALSISFIIGGINAVCLKDGSRLMDALSTGWAICVVGLSIAAAAALAAIVIDFCRLLTSFFTPREGIEWSHLFFPWQRFGM